MVNGCIGGSQKSSEPKEATMSGATEFTVIGNVLMGVMAIGGVCAMVYSVGSYMTASHPSEWTHAGTEEPTSESYKKAA